MIIVHWNIRGYRANFEEVKVLIAYENPLCMCLQETYHGNTAPNPPRGYRIEQAEPVVVYQPGEKPHRGVVTLIRQDISYYKINVATDLECLVIRVNVGKEVTLCNIYITPPEHISVQRIQNLITQLPKPFIIVGEFNARSEMWET